MAHGLFKFTAAAVVVGAALYAGIGYVGVPYATKIALDKFVSAKIGRPVMLQEVSFNPWSWTYELRGLDIPKKTGGSLLHLDHLLVDASAQTLFKLAPVLDEITIDGLHIDAVMDDALKADIAALAGKTAPGPKPARKQPMRKTRLRAACPALRFTTFPSQTVRFGTPTNRSASIRQ